MNTPGNVNCIPVNGKTLRKYVQAASEEKYWLTDNAVKKGPSKSTVTRHKANNSGWILKILFHKKCQTDTEFWALLAIRKPLIEKNVYNPTFEKLSFPFVRVYNGSM
jgi:hypothetical protein